MKKKSFRAFVLTLICAVWLVSCDEYTYQVPQQTDDGWQTAGIADVGIDPAVLAELAGCIYRDELKNVHGIVIVKDGKLVVEEYFPGYAFDYTGDDFRGEYIEYGIDTVHSLASVTKAVTATLAGIAIDKGFIKGVDEKVFGFFPEYASLCDGDKDRITVHHLLTLTSGLECNEMRVRYSNPQNDLIRQFGAVDPIEYVLAKPLVEEPGTRWYYNGGEVNVLGEIIKKTTGMRIDRFAEKYLFGPLGVKGHEWEFINPEVVHAAGNLKLRPRDVAKLGYIYLNGGTWNGRRIVSEKWIEESTQAYISVTPSLWAKGNGDKYGYHWWLRTEQIDSTPVTSFMRSGWGGQRIGVFPDLDMVVVLTGGKYIGKDQSNEMIGRYILPSVL